MAFIFLQDDPKIAVGNANDAPGTIPTPEQLGSLLVTTDGAGGAGKIYAAVPAPIAPAWISVGQGTGVGIAGSGTPNRVAKFITPTTIGDSQITDVTGGAVSISAATSVSAIANGPGFGASLQAVNGTASVIANGAGNIALLQSVAGPADVVGTDVIVTATAGNVVISAPAANAVSIQKPTANVTVGSGGTDNVGITATGDLIVAVANISLNGALFLGAFSVAGLPPGLTQAFAFATNLRNLDSAAAYPAIQAPAAGTGGLVVRFTDGIWRLAGTNIVAQQ
jgi:hypothetical protein